ncbi:Homeobox protein HD-3 [Wickerhamiella sorbophila]|uniref:Homeobox protein HD-3 n=1 Tax=Wickerhamiella sorbophila TaxID=45607 RepID=A0A2T0FH62_9ASCO|nr:Homeobox protein HD-3 [Wickerhamiella sorbophila]PRT54320.1 Homeobox protein HD-3 [Wickerhamiella sorbophila]
MDNSIWDTTVCSSILGAPDIFEDDKTLFANADAWDEFLVKSDDLDSSNYTGSMHYMPIGENDAEDTASAGSEAFTESSLPTNPVGRHQRMHSAALTTQPLVPMAHFDGPSSSSTSQHTHSLTTLDEDAFRAEDHFATLMHKVPSTQDLSQAPITPDMTLKSPMSRQPLPPLPVPLATPRNVANPQSMISQQRGSPPKEDEKPKPKSGAIQRRRMTEQQTVLLESSFQQNPRPDAAEKERLTIVAGLQLRTVQIWFQNRRAKAKARKQPSQHYDMVKHLEQKTPVQQPIVPLLRTRSVPAVPALSLSTAGAAAAVGAVSASPGYLSDGSNTPWSELASPMADMSAQSPLNEQWSRQSHLLQSPYIYARDGSGSNAASAAAAAALGRPPPLNRSKSTSVLPGYTKGEPKRRKDSNASLLGLRSGQTTPQSRVSPMGSPRAYAPRVTAAPLDARVAANFLHQQQQHRRQRSYTQPSLQPAAEDDNAPMRLSLDLNSDQARLVWVPAKKDSNSAGPGGITTSTPAAAAAAAAAAISASSNHGEPWPTYAPRTPSLGSHLGWPNMPPNAPATAPSSRRDSVASLFSLEEEASPGMSPGLSGVLTRRVSRPAIDSVPEEESQFLGF